MSRHQTTAARTVPLTEAAEAVALKAAVDRYVKRRRLQEKSADAVAFELAAFTAGWNACREALANGQ